VDEKIAEAFLFVCLENKRAPVDARLISAIMIKGVADFYRWPLEKFSKQKLLDRFGTNYFKMWDGIEKKLIESVLIDGRIKDLLLIGLEPIEYGDERDWETLSVFGGWWKDACFTRGIDGGETTIISRPKMIDLWNCFARKNNLNMLDLIRQIRKLGEVGLRKEIFI